MKQYLWLVTLLALGAGCAKKDTNGPMPHNPVTRVLLTDDPLPYDSLTEVDVYIVSIAASTSADTNGAAWVTITEPRRRVNLLELQQGATTLLGEHELPADQYRAVRMTINTDSSWLIYDSRKTDVNWNGPAEQTLHALVEAPVMVPEEGADIVIDFDLGRSFHYEYGPTGWGFNFIPWIRAVNKAATGSVAGIVKGDSLPWQYAVVTVRTINMQAYSTGYTDASGRYRIAYLLPGQYFIVTDPPASINGGYAGYRPDTALTTISQGVETEHSVTLHPF
jgi:Domain of unknown function (DUF4382)